MRDDLLRRDFLKISLAAAAAPIAMPPRSPATPAPPSTIKPEAGADRLTTYQVGPQIWIRWANQLLTSYRAHPTQKYPYLYPVSGPVSGLSLTTETSVPFPHHRSLLFACDHVNGANYWQSDVKDGQIVSAGPKLGAATPTSAEILDVCQWHKPGQPAVLADQRKITVSVVSPRLRLIDAEIQWTAVQDVTITRTNHALFALRAAADIIPWSGGTLLNSAGLQGEKATFGKTAAWCGYYGRRQGVPGNVVEGIVLMDHPKNPWAPSPWFTRDYGFISPSPFNFLEKPWQLPKGQSVALRYRVVLHAGDPQEAEIAKIYQSWAKT